METLNIYAFHSKTKYTNQPSSLHLPYIFRAPKEKLIFPETIN